MLMLVVKWTSMASFFECLHLVASDVFTDHEGTMIRDLAVCFGVTTSW